MARNALVKSCRRLLQNSCPSGSKLVNCLVCYSVRNTTSTKSPYLSANGLKRLKVSGVVLGVATLIVGSRRYFQHQTARPTSTGASFSGTKAVGGPVPAVTPTKSINLPGNNEDVKLTLYQFRSCPFCSKVRAYLDYRGLSYDVVEVNYLRRKEMKAWALSKSLPLLVVEEKSGKNSLHSLQVNESTVITSLLESHSLNPSDTVSTILDYYPSIETPGRFGKMKRDYDNKYFLMYRDKAVDKGEHQSLAEEREWREWVDTHLIRLLPPNIYRSMSESFDTVRHFSDITEGPVLARDKFAYVYAGAPAMYLLGKMLKRKYNLHDDVRISLYQACVGQGRWTEAAIYGYNLHDDVRISLYQACDRWVKAVGRERQFMGGLEPNLADLAVYGVLNTIEGCEAFSDLENNSKIKPWYDRMKSKVTTHAGSPVAIQ